MCNEVLHSYFLPAQIVHDTAPAPANPSSRPSSPNPDFMPRHRESSAAISAIPCATSSPGARLKINSLPWTFVAGTMIAFAIRVTAQPDGLWRPPHAEAKIENGI